MSEGGMDCSGFVYNALKDAGYNYGRTTAQGYRSYGTKVSKADMQPGDLVFFGSKGKATHIGIYIGNGQMIHSAGGSKNTKSNPGKGVSTISVNHRSDFLEARRY
jgi:cell wall-associated NlpC family hydrolase